MAQKYVNLKVYEKTLALVRLISTTKKKPMTEVVYGWALAEAKTLNIPLDEILRTKP